MHRAVLLSDFTLNNFAGYLKNDPAFPAIDPVLAPFGHVMQTVMDEGADCWATEPELALVWTRPESVIPSFAKAVMFEAVETHEVLADVDAYCKALQNAQSRVRWIFVPTWVLAPNRRGLGALDLRSKSGIRYLLAQMNQRLIENLGGTDKCIVLDAEKWLSCSRGQFNPKLWYAGKIPFSNDVFKEAAKDLKAAIRALSGRSKKLAVLDLDDTLWNGIVGDAGWQGLLLGGHDPAGEALVDFQRELKALKNRGIMLGIVSKNEESTALEAVRKHPEMVLRESDFAGWKINWDDKAKNIAELVNDLNVGLDSVVFIDDNPVERARVREALPEVFVPEWPSDKLLYVQALLALDCFDNAFISNEDRDRADMYGAERQRTALKSAAGSLDDWLGTLRTTVTVEWLGEANIDRIVQLFNKTNQMNLSTRRIAASELLRWASAEGRQVFAFRVTDRLGDSGLTGIASIEMQNGPARIVDFILSCRVMGRNVEHAMLSYVFDYARENGMQSVFLEYLATPKNKPCLDFLLKSNLTQEQDRFFCWDLAEPYPRPEHIEIQAALLAVEK